MNMKITIHTSNNSPITIEGSNEELNAIIDRLIAQPVSVKVDKPKTEKAPVQVVVSDNMKVKEFLESIYSYAPNADTFSGRGHAIAQAICDFNTHTITEICNKTNSKPNTVHVNIKRLRQNGAVVDVLDDTVTLVSIPKKRFTKKKWTPRNPQGSHGTTVSPVSAIAGMRLS